MNKLILALIIALTAVTAEARKKGGSTDFSSDLIVSNKTNGCLPLYTKSSNGMSSSNFQLGGTHISEMKGFCEQPVKVEKSLKEDIVYRVPGKTAYMKIEVLTYSTGECLIFARETLVRTGNANRNDWAGCGI